MTFPHHDHPYLEPHREGGFIPFAHRGGTGVAPENTLAAFRHAVSLGYRYLETDVQLTADGVLVAFHDNDLQRTCGRPGRISDLPWTEVAAARVGGSEPIPLLTDLLEEFPTAMLNIDAKSDATVAPLVQILRATASVRRVCIGSFSHRRLRKVRDAFGRDVCTSASPPEVVAWLAGRVPAGPSCLQVPTAQGPVKVVTEKSVARAAKAGLPVHVWTIDDRHEMQRLIDIGVHGIMTDRCDVLHAVARANSLWST
jgi:glycerophosphoryl diester phosphodiesterase